ncbi:hypothetical protein TVAG_261570 [Trichomonas vaginalis G3]|uniref:Uncharacterized protein n=1 Tax=Trichomonas vaginalis (strain ATCC PRA-98 / G3) TaxID=412133 RepID=A2GAB9_TRIV3|nr:hypothetical protein TVAG_261570 [Trichomonas vaginalis G3]|eukprot:XP_001298826.1 hypothetical protein [Trichomonas vaginalis G3]
MAELLISHGANINEKDNFGNTALDHATKHNNKIWSNFLSHMAQYRSKVM